MADFKIYAKNMDIKTLIITLILSALGFLIALQWRDVIKETIEFYVPTGEGLVYKWGVAIGITVIAVVVAYFLIKLEKTHILPKEFEKLVTETNRLNNGRKRRVIKSA